MLALNPPTSTRNLMATAVNGWLLAYDNISDIPRWLSDALCQLVFGGAISGRALFTNDDRSFIYAQRPVLLSGIGDFVRWADLKDRCVFLHLPPIPPTSRRAARTSFGGRFTPTVRASWGPCLTRSWAACASCRRSISRNCRAWPTTPCGVKRSAADWDGSLETFLVDL